MRATFLVCLLVGLCSSQFILDVYDQMDMIMPDEQDGSVSSVLQPFTIETDATMMTSIMVERSLNGMLFLTSAMPASNTLMCDINGGSFTATATLVENNVEASCTAFYLGGADPLPIAPAVDLAALGCSCWLVSVASATGVELVARVSTRTDLSMAADIVEFGVTAGGPQDICLPIANTMPVVQIQTELRFSPTATAESIELSHTCCTTPVVCRHTLVGDDPFFVGNMYTLTVECENLTPSDVTLTSLDFDFPTMPDLVAISMASCTSFTVDMATNTFSADGTIPADGTETCTAQVELIAPGMITDPQAVATLADMSTVASHDFDMPLRGNTQACLPPQASATIEIVEPPPTVAPTDPPSTPSPTSEAPTDPPTTAPPPVPNTPTEPADNICSGLSEISNPCSVRSNPCQACISELEAGGCLSFGARSSNLVLSSSRCTAIEPGVVIQGGIINTVSDTCLSIGFGATVEGLMRLTNGRNCILVGAEAVIGDYYGSNGQDYINLGPNVRYREIQTRGGRDIVLTEQSTGVSILTGADPDCIRVVGTGITELPTTINGGSGNDNILVDNAFAGVISGKSLVCSSTVFLKFCTGRYSSLYKQSITTLPLFIITDTFFFSRWRWQ